MTRFQFDSRLILGPLDLADAECAIRYLAARLRELGYVQETYADAVCAREKVFPTGLPCAGAGIAIPHCDAGHVITPTIAVATLSHPISFGVMGGEDTEKVDVEIIMMLAIKEPEQQIEVLRKVALFVQNADLLCRLRSAANPDEVAQLLEEAFGE